jgi:hypothetical protein
MESRFHPAMHGNPQNKFKEDRPFAEPEAAEVVERSARIPQVPQPLEHHYASRITSRKAKLECHGISSISTMTASIETTRD